MNTKKKGLTSFLSTLHGATGRTRTADLLITNQLLYQLSHSSAKSIFTAADNTLYLTAFIL